MRRQILRIFVLFIAAVLYSPYASCQQMDCFAQAKTDEDFDRCSETIVAPLEEKVEAEFARLEKKYRANDMPELVRSARESWNEYRNIQCMFEGNTARESPETETLHNASHIASASEKMFGKCVVRTLNEMYAAISKL